MWGKIYSTTSHKQTSTKKKIDKNSTFHNNNNKKSKHKKIKKNLKKSKQLRGYDEQIILEKIFLSSICE